MGDPANSGLVAHSQGVVGSGSKPSSWPWGMNNTISGNGTMGPLASPFQWECMATWEELYASCKNAEGDQHRRVRVIGLSGEGLRRRGKWPKPVVDTRTPAPQKLDAQSHTSAITKPDGKGSPLSWKTVQMTSPPGGRVPSEGAAVGPRMGNLRDPKRQRLTCPSD